MLGRPDFVEAAPTDPGDPQGRLPPASPHRYDGKATKELIGNDNTPVRWSVLGIEDA